MPLGADVRYRVKRTKRGTKVRLAFKGDTVVEAKNLRTGAMHTPAEFAADRHMRGGPPRVGYHVVDEVPARRVKPVYRHLGHFATGKYRTLKEQRA